MPSERYLVRDMAGNRKQNEKTCFQNVIWSEVRPDTSNKMRKTWFQDVVRSEIRPDTSNKMKKTTCFQTLSGQVLASRSYFFRIEKKLPTAQNKSRRTDPFAQNQLKPRKTHILQCPTIRFPGAKWVVSGSGGTFFWHQKSILSSRAPFESSFGRFGSIWVAF